MKRSTNLFYVLFTFVILISCTPSSHDLKLTPTHIKVTRTATAKNAEQPTQILATLLPTIKDQNIEGNPFQVVQLSRQGNGRIRQVVYSPDGQIIVLATSIGIRIYRSDTLELIQFIETPSDIGSLAISPDGTILAAGGMDMLFVYQLNNGVLLKTIEKNIVDLAFSPDGNFLVIGVGDWSLCGHAELEVWIVHEWVLKQTLADDLDCIGDITFSPSGKYLTASYFDVLIWEIDDGQFILKHRDSGCAIQEVSLAFTRDERFLVIGAYTNGGPMICLQRLSDWKIIGVLKKADAKSYSSPNIIPSPDNDFFATTEDSSIHVWLPNPWKIVRTIESSKKDIFDVAWSPNRKNLTSLSVSEGLQIWNVENGKLVNAANYFSGSTNSVVTWSSDLNPMAKTIDNSYNGSQIAIRESQNQTVLKMINTDGMVHSLTFSPNGKMLAVGLADDRAQIWDVENASLSCTMDGSGGYGLTRADFFDDNSKIAVNISTESVPFSSASVQIWDVKRCINIHTWEVKGKNVIIKDVNVSPNQNLVAAASFSKEIWIWDVKTGALMTTLFPKLYVESVSFSPNGNMLASANSEEINMWNVADGKLLYTFEKSGSFRERLVPSTFVWSPNGQLFGIGTENGKILLIDSINGILINTLQGHTEAINGLQISLDGKFLVSASNDETTCLWGFRP